jgi:formate hydrogenlyase transcriptional activator
VIGHNVGLATVAAGGATTREGTQETTDLGESPETTEARSEREFRQLADLLPQNILALDPDGGALYANRHLLTYLGLTLAELQVHFPAQVFHPDDLEPALRSRQVAMARGTAWEAEVRVRRHDGQYRWLLIRCSPVLDGQGLVARWYGAATDIHDLKQAQAIPRETEDRLRVVVDTMPAMVWSTLPDGSLDFANQRWLEYTGLSPQEALGWASRAVVHPDDYAHQKAGWAGCFARGEVFEGEVRLRRFDGEYRWFLKRAAPLLDQSGNIVRWYGTSTDIEDRKRAESASQRCEAHLAEAQRLAHVGGWAVGPPDTDGTEYWSPESYAIFGFDPALGPPTYDEVIARVHPDDRAALERETREIVAAGREFENKYRIVRPGGDIRVVREVGRPLLEGGAAVGYIGAWVDITEREEMTDELRRREAYLAEAQRLSLTGSFGWNLATGELYWSAETFRIAGLDPATRPTLDAVHERVSPEDRARFRETLERVAREGTDFDLEHRLVMPDGTIKHIHAVGHAHEREGGELEFVGAVMDVSATKRAQLELERAFEEIQALKEQLYRENIALREEVDKASMFEEIVGASPALQAVLSRVSKVAPTDSTVLISGETGTGKELIARAIHKRSHRASRAFVSVNCAAIPQSLIASELFGHEKGAFTGALQRRLGRFELAEGGTLFLDEVGDLPAETQLALLRVLQEREFERVGGTHVLKADVRVIAATNRDLKAAVAAGTFRSDLFYRLNVFPIELPALREREEDIPLLVEYFIDRYATNAGRTIRSISARTLQQLQAYGWPGNIRELQNVIERSLILCESDTFTVDESWLGGESLEACPSGGHLTQKLAAQERQLVEAALAASRGRVYGPSGAAAKLGIPPSTLESKIKTLKISKHRFKTP